MDKREKILKKASYIAIFGNLFLAILKLVAGITFNSFSVIGDAIDTISDVVMAFIVFFTAKIVSKPADKKYVFGYSKADAVATKMLAFFIFYAGSQLLILSIEKICSAQQSTINPTPLIAVTLISILGKLFMAFRLRVLGKRVESSMLKATAKNMQSDVLISVSVLFGLLSTMFFNLPIIDIILSILISFYIMKSAFSLAMESSVELMDGNENPEIYDQLFEVIDKFEMVKNPHRARIRKVANKYIVSFDVEMDGDLSLNKVHTALEILEEEIRNSIENIYDIRIHAEPLGSCKLDEEFGINHPNLCENKD